MSDLLIAPTYAEIAALKRHFQLLNGSPEALQYLLVSTPTPTGAQLESWLATPANLTAFQQLVSSPAGAAAVAASSTAMAAVAASSTAMNDVAASSAAMTAVLNSAVARSAVYDSDPAWNAVVASATAKAELLSRSTEHTTYSASHVYPPGSSAGVRAVLVQQRAKSTPEVSCAGANADTYITTSTTYIDRYVRVTGLTHRANSSYEDSYIKYIIMQ